MTAMADKRVKLKQAASIHIIPLTLKKICLLIPFLFKNYIRLNLLMKKAFDKIDSRT